MSLSRNRRRSLEMRSSSESPSRWRSLRSCISRAVMRNSRTRIDAATQEDRTELFPTIIAPSIKNAPVDMIAGPAAAGRESHVGIYECTVNGHRVVSDRPCGSSAQARTLVVEQPDPRDAAIAQQRLWQAQQQAQQSTSRSDVAPSDSGGSNDSEPAERGNESACAEVDRAIDQLNARMRQGYTSQEGEWLRARWHALEDQRHALRCGR